MRTGATACPADVILLVDSSGSITENGHQDNWDIVKLFVANLAESLLAGGRDNHVAAATFSTKCVQTSRRQ